MYKSLEVKQDIYWVGALDFDIRVFDIIMYTKYGTTYNSFIVKGSEKTALFEVAKETFFDEFIERVHSVQNPAEIDYIVLDHTEPDHTGSLGKLLELCPKAKVVGSGTAIKFIKEVVNFEFESIVVKDGDTLDLGGLTLNFMMVPFLHWPDSMYTYIPERKTIFTCDSFGCHYAHEEVFNDKIQMEGDFNEAYKYYFDCIMGPFKSNVLSAIEKIKDLDIETICNGHGPVIRQDPQKYIQMYKEWSTVVPPERTSVVMVYATSYGYTKKMAYEIANGIKSAGDIDVHIYDLVVDGKDEAISKINDAKGILIGSPTIVGDTLPPIWAVLSEINPIIHKGKFAGAFGSYGWSGEAVGNIEQRLNQLKMKQPAGTLKVNFNPSEEQLKQCFDYGKKFGEALI